MPEHFGEVSCAMVSWQQRANDYGTNVNVTSCNFTGYKDVTMLAIHPLQLRVTQMSMKARKNKKKGTSLYT